MRPETYGLIPGPDFGMIFLALCSRPSGNGGPPSTLFSLWVETLPLFKLNSWRQSCGNADLVATGTLNTVSDNRHASLNIRATVNRIERRVRTSYVEDGTDSAAPTKALL